jgi:DNA helicase-2/ATP-dependent DNA helicase PcrA
MALDGSDDQALRLKACLTKAPTADGSVLIIADSTKPAEQRRFARQTPGAVAAESVDLRYLVEFARAFDLSASNALYRLVQFASQVMVNVGPDDLLARVRSLQSGKARKGPTETEQATLAFAEKPSYAGASALLAAINKDGGVRAHRPPVLRGCYKMFQLCGSADGPSIYDAAVQVREQSRLIGRPLAKRTVGSTLLLKGLEADVAVILNPEVMDHNRHLPTVAIRLNGNRHVCRPVADILHFHLNRGFEFGSCFARLFHRAVSPRFGAFVQMSGGGPTGRGSVRRRPSSNRKVQDDP